ncbi:MAG TPA: hypothetical protein VLQ45_32730, partial [Thermoanaerobaculia bacterium]|nr:hypothetical protein [Thermoanaerobaculia bacterium]
GVIPGVFPLIMVLEIVLVYHLSVAHGIPFRRGELAVIWALLALASLILALIVEAILAWFPGPGWVVKGAIAFGFVMGVGWLVDSYYAAKRRKLGST